MRPQAEMHGRPSPQGDIDAGLPRETVGGGGLSSTSRGWVYDALAK